MYLRIRTFVAAAAVVVLATGCASPGRATGAIHNLVTGEELARAGDVSLYDALRQLRPTFLQSRGALPGVSSPPQPVQVYVGGLKMEGIDHLRQIMVRAVKEVRFLEPQQANARFGGNNGGGALVIVLN